MQIRHGVVAVPWLPKNFSLPFHLDKGHSNHPLSSILDLSWILNFFHYLLYIKQYSIIHDIFKRFSIKCAVCHVSCNNMYCYLSCFKLMVNHVSTVFFYFVFYFLLFWSTFSQNFQLFVSFPQFIFKWFLNLDQKINFYLN